MEMSRHFLFGAGKVVGYGVFDENSNVDSFNSLAAVTFVIATADGSCCGKNSTEDGVIFSFTTSIESKWPNKLSSLCLRRKSSVSEKMVPDATAGAYVCACIYEPRPCGGMWLSMAGKIGISEPLRETCGAAQATARSYTHMGFTILTA